jgi:hypothetical protein
VIEEVRSILGNFTGRCAVIIDDARCFGRDLGYPTIQELADTVARFTCSMAVTVKHDMIRILPARRPPQWPPMVI